MASASAKNARGLLQLLCAFRTNSEQKSSMEETPQSRIRMHRRPPFRPLPALRRHRAHVVDARAGIDQVVVRGEREEQRLLDEGAGGIVAVAVLVEVLDRAHDAVKLAGGLAGALQPRCELQVSGWVEAVASSFGWLGVASPISDIGAIPPIAPAPAEGPSRTRAGARSPPGCVRPPPRRGGAAAAAPRPASDRRLPHRATAPRRMRS